MSAIIIDISPKEIYEPLYVPKPPNIRYVHLWGGRTRGGSHEATEYAVFRITSPSYTRCAFVRQIYGDVRTSLWQDFKDRLEEKGIPESHLEKSDHETRMVYTPTGNMVKGFGIKADGSRTAKMKSLAGYNLIIIEEADELNETDFNQLDVSLRTIKGDDDVLVIMIFNPPGRRHWIWRDYNLKESEIKGYWTAEPKTDSKVLSIFSTYRDNVDNLSPSTVEILQNFKKSNPEYYYTMIEGLISEGQRGRIYNGWNHITDQQFQEIDARPVHWLDFGWSESPMAFGEAKFVKNKVYLREHIYKAMTLKELAIQLCLLGITGKELIIADCAEPTNIHKMRTGWRKEELTEEEIEKYPQLSKGFNVIPCVKGPGSVKAGILIVQGLEVYVTEGSVNIWTEYAEYKWALDKDKNPTDTPAEGFDHHQDGIRYVCQGRGRLF